MKDFYLLLLILAVSGCVTSGSSVSSPFINESQITTGMNMEEVLSILGDQAVIGQEILNENTNQFKPIMLKNPQRVETIRRGEKVFIVSFYFSEVRQADNQITDDELVPYVFENDKLKGRGWYYLNNVLKGN